MSGSITDWHTDLLRMVMCFAVDSLHAWAQLQEVSAGFRTAACSPIVLSYLTLRPMRPSVLTRAVGVRHVHLDYGCVSDSTLNYPHLFVETYPLKTFFRNLPTGLLSLKIQRAFVPGLEILDRCSNLQALHINDCVFTGLDRFPHLPHLKCLIMQGVEQFDRFYIRIPSLAPLNCLQSLIVDWSSVSDEHIKDLSSMKGLRTLVLTHCFITDVGIQQLASLPALKELVVSSQCLTDAALGYVAWFPSILFLGVQGCPNLSPSAIHSLQQSRPLLTVMA